MMIRRFICRRQFHVLYTSKTNVKPASPTPSNLKQYNLPIHDRTLFGVYMPIVLFYPCHDDNKHSPQENTRTISNRLKYALSETLTKFYPLAGRLRSLSHVECNDKGVDFVEARIGCTLSDALARSPVKGKEGMDKLFQPGSIWGKLPDPNSTLMKVQLNHFDCGGIAISLCMYHKIGDGGTLFSFIYYWAALSRRSGDLRPPHFIYTLPQSYDDDSITSIDNMFTEKYWITKEFVFHNTKLVDLKTTLASEKPSRVDALTALLYRCAVAATARSNSGSFSPSVLMQAVNVRPIMDPPLPETTFGNFFCLNNTPTMTENEIKLSSLVGRIKKGRLQLRGLKTMHGNEYLPKLIEYVRSSYRIYSSSSVCNLILNDQMDFGWGTPIETTVVDTSIVNSFLLMDTPSRDGIRALVALEEQVMETFQTDKELLAFTSRKL